MHDPMTMIFRLKYPFPTHRDHDGKWVRDVFITIWHCDPETDGTDDSCGLYKRSRHGDKEVFEAIKNRFETDWTDNFGGWFDKNEKPTMSTFGITLNMFWMAAFEHFRSPMKADKFCSKHLSRIAYFAENPTDSFFPFITNKYDNTDREDRIREAVSIVYGCILRWDRKWYRHPKWHVHHWHVQIHPLQKLKRRLFLRCSRCGKPFGWNESPTAMAGDKRRWHDDCYTLHTKEHK